MIRYEVSYWDEESKEHVVILTFDDQIREESEDNKKTLAALRIRNVKKIRSMKEINNG